MGTLGENLKARRKELGLTQPEVEAASGIAQSNISRIERGEIPNPGIETLTALALALKTDVDALRAGESGYRVVYDDRYPNRERALAPLVGELHPKTPPRVRSVALNSTRDLTVIEWTRQILAENDRVLFEEAHPAAAAAQLVTAETAPGADKLGPPPAKWPGGKRPKPDSR